MLLICRDTEVLPQTSSRVPPKDGRKSKRQKASGTRRVYELVTFFLIMHTCDNLSKVEQFVREIDGVESVRGDSNSNKLEVKGKVDPGKIQKKVKRKTKTKVKLIFPPAESEGYGDEHERGDKKLEEKTRPDDVANTAENEGYGDEHERGDKKLEEKTRPDDVANTKSEEESIKLGPWGGQGGSTWSYKPSGAITGIVVAHGNVVDSISFTCVNENGINENSNKFGGSGGTAEKISIAWPNEYLTSISGTQNKIFGIEVIESLSFYTNQAKYGPFGHTKGTSFDLPIEGGVIVGFYGSDGEWLDSIGFYAKRLCSCLNKESIKLGPWGGPSGTAWSYNPGGPIIEITIAAGDIVDSISFTSVDKNRTKDVSKKFGGNGGTTTKISIDWPQEYLTSISGTRGTICGIVAIQSLTFYTNKTKYGPFGKTTGSYFELRMEHGIIGGFNGAASILLDSIGVYAKPSCY